MKIPYPQNIFYFTDTSSKNIDLKEQNLEFVQEGVQYKLKLFRPASMTIDVSVYENGKFIKISSKGDFGGNNFLDISMKKNKNSETKFLEVYSDLPRPLLTEYSFFNGLSGGKLLFTSLIDGSKSISKLKIENFNVINAPGLIKLLSLADLGGLADLAKGDGLSFSILEISVEKEKNYLC